MKDLIWILEEVEGGINVDTTRGSRIKVRSHQWGYQRKQESTQAKRMSEMGTRKGKEREHRSKHTMDERGRLTKDNESF